MPGTSSVKRSCLNRRRPAAPGSHPQADRQPEVPPEEHDDLEESPPLAHPRAPLSHTIPTQVFAALGAALNDEDTTDGAEDRSE